MIATAVGTNHGLYKVFSRSYTYDNVSNLITRADLLLNNTDVMIYDALNRLTVRDNSYYNI
jgi:hypothetical protein